MTISMGGGIGVWLAEGQSFRASRRRLPITGSMREDRGIARRPVMQRRSFVLALAGALVLAACSLPTVDKEADAKARTLFEQIRSGADLSASTDLDADLRTPEALAQLAAIRSALPPGTPTAVANRSWSYNAGTGGTTASLIHAYSYPSATVLAETVLAKGKDKVWKITGFHVKLAAPGAPEQRKAPAVTVEDQPKDV